MSVQWETTRALSLQSAAMFLADTPVPVKPAKASMEMPLTAQVNTHIPPTLYSLIYNVCITVQLKITRGASK